MIYNLSEKNTYLSDVLMTLTITPYAMRRNQRSYDRFKDKKVKTLHYAVWDDPREEHSERVERIRRYLMSQ